MMMIGMMIWTMTRTMMTELLVTMLAVSYIYVEVQFLAYLPEKVQVPCDTFVLILVQEHVDDTLIRGMYHMMVETLHPP